jgi:hypothetical protein
VPWPAGDRVIPVAGLAAKIQERLKLSSVSSARFARWMIEPTPSVTIEREPSS